MRKFYANASFSVYENRIRLVTKKYIDRSTFASNVLGHGGSVATSLSYANLVVKFGYDPKLFKIPPEELLRNLMHENAEMKREMAEFRKMITDQVKTIALEKPADESLALFTNKSGEEVSLPKRKKQVFTDNDEIDEALRHAIESLKTNNISVSSNQIMKLGFGRKVIQEFTKRHPTEMVESLKRKADDKPPDELLRREFLRNELDEKHVEEPPSKKPGKKSKRKKKRRR